MHDSKPDADELFSIAASQAGYFTAAQARASGFSWSLLSHHVLGGRFLRFQPGLYRFKQYPSAPREEVMAAWLAAGEDAVVSHESALDLLGLADSIPNHIHLTVPRSKRWRRAPGVAVHTITKPMHVTDVVVREGLRVTSPARTILDVAQAGGAPDVVLQAARQALARGMVTPEQLLAGATERGAPAQRLISAALGEVVR